MGCCDSSSKLHPGTLTLKIRQCMSSGTIFNLNYYISILMLETKNKFNVDTFILKDEAGNNATLLALAFVYGRVDIVKYLESKFSASCFELEKFLRKSGTSGLQIIAENAHLALFDYYVPIYLSFKHLLIEAPPGAQETLILDQSRNSKEILELSPESQFSPVQYACINNHISVVKLCFNFNSKLTSPIEEFDVDGIDKNYGNNCALLACKICSFGMIRFLHTVCNADFHKLNFNKESTLQVLIAESNKEIKPDFFRCLKYLIETISVNVCYNYEETLIMLENHVAFDYFLKKLNEKGLSLSKDIIKEQVWKQNKLLGVKTDQKSEGNLTDILQKLRTEELSSIFQPPNSVEKERVSEV